MDTVKLQNKGNCEMIAHRGVSGIELENTCAAFVAAGNRSYFGIETDVHRTADGQYVIIHDDTTTRVTGQELVNGIMEHAVEQYSFLAPEIFLFWGVTSGPDIGNIVYNMIALELLSASPEDSKSDFDCMEDLIGELRKKVEPRPEDISVEPPPILDR